MLFLNKKQKFLSNDTFTLTTDQLGNPLPGTLTNEANVNFDVPEGQLRYLTAGNDVVDLSKWDGTVSVNIGDAFSSDNDKVEVMAGALNDNLKLTSIENLEIVNANTTAPIIPGTNFKGLEAIKLIGDATTLDVSNFTYGVKIEATENADTIIGSNKADTINGGAGNDIIVGNGGVDIFTGGNGADEFVVGTVRDAGVDQILDFSSEDKIYLKGFSAQELKKFDASTFSTVTYKTLDSVLATFATGGANVTKNGDVVIFSYDGKTYALLANGAFDEKTDALVDITGANVASLTESNFGTSGAFENYVDFKAAVDEGKVTATTTIKSITADNAAALLTTDKNYLANIEDGGIGAVTETPVTVNMTDTDTRLDTSEFAKKLGAGVTISAININGTDGNGDIITSSFTGKIDGSGGDNIITVSTAATINSGNGNDTINASAATGTVIINAGAGNNEITGGSGNDNITTGTTGTNSIKAGAGNDNITLNSSAGADTIIFEADATTNGKDTITGFSVSGTLDKLDFRAFATLTVGDTNVSSSANKTFENNKIYQTDTSGTITGKDYGGANFGDLFADNGKAFNNTTANGNKELIVVKGTDETQIYYVSATGNTLTADMVDLVAVISDSSGAGVTLAAGNFVLA